VGEDKKIKVKGNNRDVATDDDFSTYSVQVHNNKFSSNALAFSAGLSVAATLLFAAF